MALRDELEQRGASTPCAVERLLKGLDKATAKELLELVNDRTVYASSLARLVKSKGWYPASDQSINRHRRGDCLCR